ncbi:MAG: type II toxin-antitoxin system RelE/ParE family toxin [Gammaproteobacteria bacterium]|nr:type II toxin-antitoxin system RelE/ParE family toxin [Gammaproteobacteria bacterium]
MGREVPEAEERDDVRELIFQDYRIIYLRQPDYIYIVTMIHGSRDLSGMDNN